MATAASLLLLADHIKLSLLERERARTLNLSRDSQDGHLSRSLDQFRDGIESLEREQQRLQEAGDETKATNLLSTLTTLRQQHADLTSQFHGFASPSTTTTLTHPNDPSLAPDFIHAQSSSATTTTPSTHKTATPKTVRFTDNPSEDDLEAQRTRRALLPYSDNDDDTAGYRDHIESNNLSNTQIHAYHERVLAEQDAQLDALGASIGRQRELSMRIGDELDEQVAILDEADGGMDRQQGMLDRARRQVGRVARGGGSETRQMTVIVVLIIVLVLLIIILK